MYILQLWIRYLERYSEVLPDEAESAALTVEDLAALTLADLPGTVCIEDVKLRFSPPKVTGVRRCILDVYIHLPEQTTPLKPWQLEGLEFLVETGMSYGLMELFGYITIEQTLLRYQPVKQRGILRPVYV